MGLPNIIVNYFMNSADTGRALDMIEMSFQVAIRANRDYPWKMEWRPKKSRAPKQFRTLNQRFLEHGVGYAFIDGGLPQLVRKDNDHLHGEVVIPALRLLHEEGFTGANSGFRKAHEHYRQGAYKGGVTVPEGFLKYYENNIHQTKLALIKILRQQAPLLTHASKMTFCPSLCNTFRYDPVGARKRHTDSAQ